MSKLMFFYVVSKTAIIPLASDNLTQNQNQGVQLHHITFHLDQLKSVQENVANRFCFLLTFWPPAKVKIIENGLKW